MLGCTRRVREIYRAEIPGEPVPDVSFTVDPKTFNNGVHPWQNVATQLTVTFEGHLDDGSRRWELRTFVTLGAPEGFTANIPKSLPPIGEQLPALYAGVPYRSIRFECPSECPSVIWPQVFDKLGNIDWGPCSGSY